MAKKLIAQCRQLNISHFNTLVLAFAIWLMNGWWEDLKVERKATSAILASHTTELAIHETRIAMVEGGDQKAKAILDAYKKFNRGQHKKE